MEAEVDLLSYCAREWKGDTPRAKLMRKVCLFVEVVEDGGRVWKSQETNSPFCFMDPVNTKCGTRDNGGSNLKAKQLLDRWLWAFYLQPVPSRTGVNSVRDVRNLKRGSFQLSWPGL